jgi:ADP-ribosyl-[dinitrogen reductase] hydrolase
MIQTEDELYLSGKHTTKRKDSVNHPYHPVVIYNDTPGVLYIGAAPGKKDFKWNRDLDTDLDTIEDYDINVIFCLLEWDETARLSIPDLAMKAQHRGLLFYQLPTVDHTAPSLETLVVVVPLIVRYLMDGYNVLVHCRGGMGRAVTVAACTVLYLNRVNHQAVNKDVIHEMRLLRPGSLKNKSQVKTIQEYAKLIS